jgi:hypothetical protein
MTPQAILLGEARLAAGQDSIMKQEFLDVLARLAPAGKPEQLDLAARELEVLAQRLAATLNDLGDARARNDILAYFNDRTRALLANGRVDPQPTKYPPELLEWARSQFTEEELLAGLQEIRTTGGLELRDFIDEMEEEGAPP